MTKKEAFSNIIEAYYAFASDRATSTDDFNEIALECFDTITTLGYKGPLTKETILKEFNIVW